MIDMYILDRFCKQATLRLKVTLLGKKSMENLFQFNNLVSAFSVYLILITYLFMYLIIIYSFNLVNYINSVILLV